MSTLSSSSASSMIRRLSVFKGKSPTVSSSPTADSTTRDLAQFLNFQKVNYRRAVEQRQARQWSVVMGNEAGDLDSLASAIGYAWYATNHLQRLTIPLVQVERDDFVLRAENLHALECAGIDPNILLTADEIPPPSGETYALVDHNRLDVRFAYISQPAASGSVGHGNSPPTPGSPIGAESKVVAIVDHHADEGAHRDAKLRIVEPSGSCASLVTRLFTAIPNYTIPPELALLLLSAITIDTNALKEGGKALQVDREAADWLLPQANLDASFSISTKDKDASYRTLRELNDVLQSKKNDVAHLDTRDLLRRDYKEYMFAPAWAPENTLRAGLATVPRGLKGWLADLRPSSAGSGAKGKDKSSPDFWDACVAYMDERGLDALGVLTTWRDDGRIGHRARSRREQAWLVRAASDDAELPRRLWSGLEESKVLKAKRKDGKRYAWAKEGWVARVYEQGDASATRKATAPLLRDIVEGPKPGL